MNISSSPAVFAPSIPTYPVVGQKPVGLESEDGRKRGSRPVEQTASTTPGRAASQQAQATTKTTSPEEDATPLEEATTAKYSPGSRKAQQVRDQIQRLAQRDRDVRAHEQAHMAAGGALAGSAHYDYVKGPDGVSYAVSGEVPIDAGPGATPQESLEKAETLRRAALAPADPSAQDRRVAADAARLELNARQEISQQQLKKQAAANHPATTKGQDHASASDNAKSKPSQETRTNAPALAYEQVQTPPGSLLKASA